MVDGLALISVSDKTDVVNISSFLYNRGVEILSTGGTARAIRGGGVSVTEVSKYTGFPESPDGLVKTLHPKIHGGWLLNNPSCDAYMAFCASQGIRQIDYVIVNLYPFEEFVGNNPDCTLEQAMEQMDIGGPAMIRGAAKAALKYGTTTVITHPSQYERVIKELNETGEVSACFKRHLAVEAIRKTRDYDSAITNFLDEVVVHGK